MNRNTISLISCIATLLLVSTLSAQEYSKELLDDPLLKNRNWTVRHQAVPEYMRVFIDRKGSSRYMVGQLIGWRGSLVMIRVGEYSKVELPPKALMRVEIAKLKKFKKKHDLEKSPTWISPKQRKIRLSGS